MMRYQLIWPPEPRMVAVSLQEGATIMMDDNDVACG
jgi:hypothetical protein